MVYDNHAECDESLCGSNLSPAEVALFTAKRKEAYEALHPETVNGTNQHSRVRQVGEPSKRFTADTAEKTGQSERKAHREARRLAIRRAKLSTMRRKTVC